LHRSRRLFVGLCGHNPLLAEAIVDAEMQLFVVETDGRKSVTEQDGDAATVITPKGKLLTVTDKEALACGLSAGTVSNYEQLGDQLGYPHWTECKGLGVSPAKYWQETISIAEDQYAEPRRQFKEFARQIKVIRQAIARRGHRRTVDE